MKNSDEALINEIIDLYKNKQGNPILYIVHNLYQLNTEKEIEDYFKERILSSFKLINRKIKKTGISYYEDKSYDIKNPIYHLIFAKEGTPLGEKYNNPCISNNTIYIYLFIFRVDSINYYNLFLI